MDSNNAKHVLITGQNNYGQLGDGNKNDIYLSAENAKKIVKKKEKVLDLTIHMGKSHVERVGKGKCSSKLTVPFNHVLQNIGRMGNCCVNIADAVLAQSDLNEFTAFVKEEN